MMNSFRMWLLKKVIEYALEFLSMVPEYFETAKRKREELKAYQESILNKQLTEEQKREAIKDFID